MIYANYIRYREKCNTEFEDDELGVAAYYLADGMFEGRHSIVNITNEKGEILMAEDEIIEAT